MRATFATVLMGSALVAIGALNTTANGIDHRNALDELSLDELLALRENILEAKHNLTYVIEESDGEDSDDEGDDEEDDIMGDLEEDEGDNEFGIDDYDDEELDDEYADEFDYDDEFDADNGADTMT